MPESLVFTLPLPVTNNYVTNLEQDNLYQYKGEKFA